MTTYSDIVKDEVSGQPVANVSVYVYNLDKTLATITPTNPVVTDSYGEFSFTAADGIYRVSYVVGGKTVEKDYIIVGVGPSIPTDVVAALIPFQAATVASQNAAATSAGQAATSAGQSATSAANSALYEAAALALANGWLFPNGTVIAPLAAAITAVVADGKPFLIAGASGGATFATLYFRSGTAATATGLAIPSAAAVTDEDTRALLGSLPRGAIGIWPFDRYNGTIIPNLIDGSSNIVTTAGNTLVAGVFTGNGTITFGSAQALSNWTVSCLAQVTGINSYNSILYDSDAQNNFGFRSVSTTGGANTGGPGWVQNFDVMRVGISAAVYQGQRGGLMNLVGKGYHVLTMRQDATGITYWIDDVKLYNNIGAILGALNITHLTFSKSPDTLASQHTYAGFLGLWDRGLSDAEVRQAVYAQRARVATNAIYPAERSDRIFIAEGDSNHGPIDANSWVWQFGANDSPENFGGSYAITGSTVTDLAGRAALVDAILPPDTLGRKFIMSVGIGTNDLPNYNSTTVSSVLIPLVRAYMMARKAAGWKLAMFTVPRRGDLAGAAATNFETVRAIYNADILANPTLYGLASSGQVINIGAATGIGSSFDSTKYAVDLLHFSATGGAQVEALARPVINAL